MTGAVSFRILSATSFKYFIIITRGLLMLIHWNVLNLTDTALTIFLYITLKWMSEKSSIGSSFLNYPQNPLYRSGCRRTYIYPHVCLKVSKCLCLASNFFIFSHYWILQYKMLSCNWCFIFIITEVSYKLFLFIDQWRTSE